MTPLILLRLASGITLVYAAGHTMGALDSWSPPGNTPVLESMRSFRFDAMGVSRTYLDFYIGFGVYISVLLLLQAVVLWQLANLVKTDQVRPRPVVGAVFMASLAGAVVVWRFIFPLPALLCVAIAVCLGSALLMLRRSAPR